MSEKITDKSAGLNGGFEVFQNGLPVNWLMYTSKTVPNSDFKIILDKSVFKEGQQSLKFEVKKCTGKAAWRSPGFTNEFFEVDKFMGEATYRISFWIKNSGTKFRITTACVKAMTGDDSLKKIIEENTEIVNWKYMEIDINIPKDYWLKMELSILEPGTFWIDDIKIDKIE
ncbi:MAG: hypothetical protein COX07_04790 [Bacteroidetes bacterium CG23_combo_of_CG06-09_8_20_14_all_32_9]|nr:MAG: hypothetical protein COX07_04790 [Bacteroidetes bacterium CG23_combo_of_CG06-09_8_20_14_all_32_9]